MQSDLRANFSVGVGRQAARRPVDKKRPRRLRPLNVVDGQSSSPFSGLSHPVPVFSISAPGTIRVGCSFFILNPAPLRWPHCERIRVQ